MKKIGEYKISEISRHIDDIANQYKLNPSNAKHFEIIRKLLIQRFYSSPCLEIKQQEEEKS